MLSKRHIQKTVILYILLVALPSAYGLEFTGKVVGIIDGDTIDVLNNGKSERVRLHGIDCPEKHQAYGTKAKLVASALAFNRAVTVVVTGYDRYKRTIGEVFLPDGKSLNRSLVMAGYAWWYKKYALGD